MDVYYDPASIMVTWVWLVVNCIMRKMWYAFYVCDMWFNDDEEGRSMMLEVELDCWDARQ